MGISTINLEKQNLGKKVIAKVVCSGKCNGAAGEGVVSTILCEYVGPVGETWSEALQRNKGLGT